MARLPLRMSRASVPRDVVALTARWVNQLFAAGMLAVIVFATIRIWPIPYLGFQFDPRSFEVKRVEPGSSAAQAGVHVGDRIIRLYDHPIEDVISSIRVVELIGPRSKPVPMVVDRGGRLIALSMVQGEPSRQFQASKLVVALLALLCWTTGYVLGVVRRHDASSSYLAASFWLGLGGLLGAVPVAQYTAFPILLVLVWLLIGVFVPLSIYIHLWFPPRLAVASRLNRSKAKAMLLGSMVIINCAIGAWAYLARLSMIDLLWSLLRILPFALLLGVSGSGFVLYRAYRQTTIAHTRRQIRLIAVACCSIALLWTLFLIVPTVVVGHSLIPETGLELLGGAMPLAYLLSGVAADLYRIDRLATRFLLHLGVATTLVAGLAVIAQFLPQTTVVGLWMAMGFVVLYRPVQRSVSHLLPGSRRQRARQHVLETAVLDLTRTLDAAALAATIVEGVRAAFGQPALAFYLGDVNRAGRLTLQHEERMADVPVCLLPGTLTEYFSTEPAIIESRALLRHLQAMTLTPDEQKLMMHPAIALWCPIQHHGHLLGLLLLGMRDDLDPYRHEDQQALQRLSAAAALALANSATFARQQEAEDLIRQLYQRLQAIQDATAQAIAREVHDELLNVHCRLNLQSIQNVANQMADPALQEELDLLLKSQQTMSGTLRSMCENLYPTGLEDPYGLPAVLRMQVQKQQARWHGSCQLLITGVVQPVAARIQREVLRITKEALANAVTHANADGIIVHLRYPSAPDDYIELRITDNGCATEPIAPKPGHWGMRFMQESARSAAGTLAFQHTPGYGTEVVFRFPSGVVNMNFSEELGDNASSQAV